MAQVEGERRLQEVAAAHAHEYVPRQPERPLKEFKAERAGMYRTTFTMTTGGATEVREFTSLHALSEYIHNLHWRGEMFDNLVVTKV